VINIGIDNHPLKEFVNKDQEVVVILVGVDGTKHNELWRL
jgi:hypothetical protein